MHIYVYLVLKKYSLYYHNMLPWPNVTAIDRTFIGNKFNYAFFKKNI